MPANLYILNLSGDTPNKLAVGDLALGGSVTLGTDPNQIPDTDEPLVLYIVGHAVPDALVLPEGLIPTLCTTLAIPEGTNLLADEALAVVVQRRRGQLKTVIIWDFCFAKSFQNIGNGGWAGFPYVHIFGCEAHEQAWHAGEPRETLLSIALTKAIAGGITTWEDLEGRLVEHLASVQQPSIYPYQPNPVAFGMPLPSPDKVPTLIERIVQFFEDLLGSFIPPGPVAERPDPAATSWFRSQ
jgi:hypothetical protein